MVNTFYKKCTMLFMSLCMMVHILIAQPISWNNAATQPILSKASEVSYDDRSKALLPAYARFDPNQAPEFAPNEAAINAILGLPTTSAFKLIKQESDDLGFTHFRYQQMLKDAPIEGAVYLFHVKNQKLVSMNGHCLNTQALTAMAEKSADKLTEGQALQAALAHVNAKQYKWQIPSEEQALRILMKDSTATYTPNGEKVYIFPKNDFNTEGVRLAYKFSIFAHFPMTRRWIFVDAENGKILMEEEQIHETDAPCLANTAYSGQQAITANFTGSQYELKETTRGGGITTNQVLSQPNPNTIIYAQLQSTSSTFNVTAPQIYNLDVHFGTEKTYDYFKNIHNRNSIDNNGFPLTSFVNVDLPALNPGYPNSDNAFWNGYAMYYGKGTNFNPFVCVDVTGHEITHGLTSKTANLIYQYESGALNESFSDIFGTAIEFYANTSPNWTLGEKSGLTIRDMSNPNARNHPDTYSGSFWYTGGGDNGGVHVNSGVQNFWFYLLAIGGSGTNDIGVAYTVQGIGIDKAAKIAFRNLTTYLTPFSNYANARTGAIAAATDLYGAGSNEVTQVTKAWCAVGVGNACVPNTLPTVALTNPLNNATFTAPATFPITATAADADGTIKKVEFFNGAFLLGTATTAPYTITGTNAPVGTYTLTAKAHDNLNGITTSAPITIVVTASTGLRTFPVGLPTCLEDDFRELEKLYNATGGDNWTNKTGWFTANMATWKGITLTANGCDVLKIDLSMNNLVGTISDFNLPNLTTIWLSNNKLSGTIPNFNLPNLVVLQIHTNQFTGTIPNFNLPNLQDLGLSSNQLSGTLPNFNLPNLKTLNSFQNKLSGVIPNFNLPNLNQLILSSNQLTGTIPNFNLPALKELGLYQNQLTGAVPNFNLPNLTGLYLDQNLLTGAIPNFNLPSLQIMSLPYNQLSGAIPNFNLPNLKYAYLTQNQLSGTIPNFNLPNLIGLRLNKNLLSGTIPTLSLPNVTEFWLSDNQLTGTIPSFSLPVVKSFYLSNNQLSGCLPSALRSLCLHVTAASIAGNPNLATQDWAAFCANGTGQCTIAVNTAYVFAPTTVKCSDVTVNIPIALGKAIQNINEGYTISISYDVNKLTLVDATKGAIVPADASLLKTLSAGNDIFGIALSSTNISGNIGDVLLNLQFTLKPAAAVANTAITLTARIVEAKSGMEQLFDASKTYTVTGANAAKIMVYNNGVMLSDAVSTTVQWTGTATPQTATLSGGQVVLNNTGNTTLGITRQANIPNGAPVIGGQDAFKAWNILSNFAGYKPTVDEIIAADANGNGTISIADITAILKRGSGLLPTGFPQASGGNKDWRFYPSALRSTPAFTISAKYPFCDGSGYCSTNVPIITNTYPLQMTSSNCDVITKEWSAVLIGNVTGTTGSFFRDPSVVASLRGAPPTVKFMLTDSVRTAAGLFIPLFITDVVPTTGLDMAFTSPAVVIEGMTDTVMNYSINSSSSVSISAFSVSNEGVTSGTKIGYLKLQTTVQRKLNPTDFGTVVANVNGETTNARIEFTSAILSAVLTKFEAHPLSKNVELTWSTANEQQNNHFEVQRSSDGKTFSKIGRVKGQGTTTVQHEYPFLDEAPYAGINYYRLKQVDVNGQFEFSKIISVNRGNSDKTISIYPNPIKDKVTIETNITGNYSIDLYDITGKLLQRHQAHQPILQLSTSDLSSGVYMISVTSQAVQKTFKIVKQ